MKRKASFLLGLVLALSFSLFSAAQGLKPIQLPPPQTTGGRPLMQVLSDRKSTREFGPGTLSPQTLSNLLWAAFGINRPDGRRTAPSAMNWQEVSIYVATPEGVYIYDAKDNALNPVLAGDFRAATGTQSFVKDAAVNLVYVSDLSKTETLHPPRRKCTPPPTWDSSRRTFISTVPPRGLPQWCGAASISPRWPRP